VLTIGGAFHVWEPRSRCPTRSSGLPRSDDISTLHLSKLSFHQRKHANLWGPPAPPSLVDLRAMLDLCLGTSSV